MAKKRVPDFPLFLHRNGQWAKKVKGRLHYFGTDKEAALDQWLTDKDYLLAGRVPPRRDTNPTIAELGNLFVANRREKVAAGDIESRTADEYEATIGRLIGIVGKGCRVEHLRPLDFAGIKAKLAEPVNGGVHNGKGRTVTRRSPGTVGGDVRRLRVFLNWCYKAELIETPPRFGDEFSPPSRKEQRRRRVKDGRKDFMPEQIHAVLAECKPSMKAITLVGINAGVGNLDVSLLEFRHLGDTSGDEWLVDFPRNKTGAPRRFYLWPETVEAIRAYLDVRPKPRHERYADRLFLTRLGHPWIRESGKVITDSIAFSFRKARNDAGIDRGSFYDLRRTFRTVAAGSRDREAVDLIMGHAEDADDMGAIYTQHIENERLKAVADHVRQWLYGETE